MSQSKTFCSAPWQATYYKESRKQYKMCCSLDRWTTADSPEDYFNSAINRSVRESILAGEWHPGCRICEEQERAGGHSDRHNFNKLLNAYSINDIDVSQLNLRWLDYRPGNLCNLKCRMCDPGNSSLIAQEVAQDPTLAKFHGSVKPSISNELEGVLTNPELFKNLEYLKILGGEPTIDPQVYKLLEWIVDNDFAKNINLRYTTNLTNINDRWCNYVNQFASSKPQISLDGTGATYEYIRTPAKWRIIKRNIEELGSKIHNANNVGINMVYSLYTCFTIKEWLPELLEVADILSNSFNTNCRINLLNCTTPYLEVRHLPDRFKEIVLNDLSHFNNDVAKLMTFYTQKSGDTDKIKDFFEYNKKLDILRKTNINTLSSSYTDLEKYYEQ
jgi:organic radical activating enzyme